MKRKKHSQFFLPDAVNVSIGKGFTQIPNSFLRNPDISSKAKLILSLLLSNKDGWHSCKTQLLKCVKEKEQFVESALSELTDLGYLLRIRYRDKLTKSWKGSIWAYTDKPHWFDLQSTLDLLKQNNLEPHKIVHTMKTHMWENRIWYIININNNINNYYNNTIFIPPKKNGGMIRDKNKIYHPISERLAGIILSKKNIKFSHQQLSNWNNSIRLLEQSNGISTHRMNAALDWYEENIGGEYVPVIESGNSFRDKFMKLENAMKRNGTNHSNTKGTRVFGDSKKYKSHDVTM